MRLKVLLLFLLCFFSFFVTSSLAAPVKFSQPVLIGTIYIHDGQVFLSKQELPSSQENKYYDFKNEKMIIRIDLSDMSKGIARFGVPNNKANNVKFDLVGPFDIYEVALEDRTPFVYIIRSYNKDGSVNISLIGMDKKMGIVKYLDNADFAQLFNTRKDGSLGSSCKISSKGNTLVFSCSALVEDGKWEYLVGWNEDKEWFDIKYRPLPSYDGGF